mgnify:CR=1 FL=1
MNATNKQLTILSELEKAAFYDLPVFNYEAAKSKTYYYSTSRENIALTLQANQLLSNK